MNSCLHPKKQAIWRICFNSISRIICWWQYICPNPYKHVIWSICFKSIYQSSGLWYTMSGSLWLPCRDKIMIIPWQPQAAHQCPFINLQIDISFWSGRFNCLMREITQEDTDEWFTPGSHSLPVDNLALTRRSIYRFEADASNVPWESLHKWKQINHL